VKCELHMGMTAALDRLGCKSFNNAVSGQLMLVQGPITNAPPAHVSCCQAQNSSCTAGL
jgi:hypothetical protein